METPRIERWCQEFYVVGAAADRVFVDRYHRSAGWEVQARTVMGQHDYEDPAKQARTCRNDLRRHRE